MLTLQNLLDDAPLILAALNGDPTRRTRVLVADDDRMLRTLAQAVLEPYTVLLAVDAADAVATALCALPEIIVLDQSMPDGTGVEVLRRLKREPTTRAIPVIMLSAHDDEASVAAAMDAGACAYLPKARLTGSLCGLVAETLRSADKVELRARSGLPGAAALIAAMEQATCTGWVHATVRGLGVAACRAEPGLLLHASERLTHAAHGALASQVALVGQLFRLGALEIVALLEAGEPQALARAIVLLGEGLAEGVTLFARAGRCEPSVSVEALALAFEDATRREV